MMKKIPLKPKIKNKIILLAIAFLLITTPKLFAEVWLEVVETCVQNPYYASCVSASYHVIIHWTPYSDNPWDVCGYDVFRDDGVNFGGGNQTATSSYFGNSFGGGYCGTSQANARQVFQDVVSAFIETNYNHHTFVVQTRGNCLNQPPIVIGTISFNMPSKAPQTNQTDKSKQTVVGHPINIADGNMYTEEADLFIPSKELPLEFSRAYNSQDNFNGQLGFGWRSNFDITLAEQPDSSVLEINEKGVYTLYKWDTYGGYISPAGKYSVLTKNSDGTFQLVEKQGRNLYFDTKGRLVKIEGRNGNVITIFRNSNGRIVEVTDPAGRKLLFTNDTQGRVTQITDPANRTFKYEYDSNGNLVKVTDPLNNITTYQYDANHNLTCKTDANNHSLYFEYDSSDRAHHSWQDGNINEITLSFAPDNLSTTVTDSRGNPTKYEYNTYGLVTKIIDSQNNVRNFTWDANLNKTSFTNQNSHTTSYIYDSRGNLLMVTDHLNNTTTFTYEPSFDFVKTITDAQNNVTTYDYDVKGNPITLTDAFGNITTNTYDAQGLLTATTNPKNHTTVFTHDEYGNLATATDALNNITTFSYDAIGNRIETRDAKNNRTHFTFNSLNQLTRVTYPDNSMVNYTYDGVGNRTSITDNASHTTYYTYNANDKVTSIRNPLNNIISFTYDSEGNLIKVTDQNLHETTYVYDTLNRLISETNALGLIKTYVYDAAGNRTSVTDANNNTINYEYGSLNRLKKITYPSGSSVSFEYDSLGRRSSMQDSHGTTSYTYDKLGRLTQVDGPLSNDTLQYIYDEIGNRTSLILPDGKTVQYTYDALARLVSITDPDNKTTTYTYDEVGNPLSVTYPNNIVTTYSFDAMRRLIHLTNQNQDTLERLSEFIYTYDQAGRRARVDLLDGAVDYQYDALGQLTNEQKVSASGDTLYGNSFEYDPAGNRSRMVKDGKEYLYAYNDANHLTQESISGPGIWPITVVGTVTDASGIKSLTVNDIEATLEGEDFTCEVNLSLGPNTLTVSATDAAGNTATKTVNVTYDNQVDQILYVYDNNGNLIRRQSAAKTLNLSYDYENRLSRVSSSGTSITYGYDGEGKRISFEDSSDFVNYLYDGMDVVLESDVSGNPVAIYLRNPYAQGGIGGIISKQGLQGTEVYYSYDGLGSTANLSDPTGANLQSYAYYAFGNLLNPAYPNNNRQFLAKEVDPSGLIYFGARYYDPRIGRFITPDPLGMVDGPNVYLYCLNDPVNLVDLWGLCQKSWWDRYLYESVLPGPYGQPMSEWNVYGPSSWGNPMQYTEEAGGWWMWGERITVGISATAAISAGTLIGLEATGISNIGSAEVGWKGGEITLTRPGAQTPDWRFNPLGHYHRRPGIGQHRPWEGGW